jgi:hypothetical protein
MPPSTIETTLQAIGDAIRRADVRSQATGDQSGCASRARIGVEGGSSANGGAVRGETRDVIGVATMAAASASPSANWERSPARIRRWRSRRRAVERQQPIVHCRAWERRPPMRAAHWSKTTRTTRCRRSQRPTGGCGVSPDSRRRGESITPAGLVAARGVVSVAKTGERARVPDPYERRSVRRRA